MSLPAQNSGMGPLLHKTQSAYNGLEGPTRTASHPGFLKSDLLLLSLLILLHPHWPYYQHDSDKYFVDMKLKARNPSKKKTQKDFQIANQKEKV